MVAKGPTDIFNEKRRVIEPSSSLTPCLFKPIMSHVLDDKLFSHSDRIRGRVVVITGK
jgi:hypothetical protein